MPVRRWVWGFAVALAACAGERAARNQAVVVAAVGEPESVLPPLVTETVGRDISDLVFERLADLQTGAAPMDTGAYAPRLAARWDRIDARTLRFHLREDARWSDGRPLTADDVAFSFAAFADSAIDSPARPYLQGADVAADDPKTVRVTFATAYPEQLYDATYHVRIIPRHVWDSIPRERWAADTGTARLVGSGPFRVAAWRRGRFLRLERRSRGSAAGGGITAVIWRFAGDPDAALNLILGHQADLMELAAIPAAAPRVAADDEFQLLRYPSAAYGFLGFNLFDRQRSRGHAVLDRATRRALALATDRTTLARSVFGPEAVAPPGPMSRLLWIWSDEIRTLPFDSVAAVAALEAAGWERGGDGMRRRRGAALALEILVPATSGTRRQLATALQAAWRSVGASATVTAVDFPVFQERLRLGRFDSYIGAWLDEPSARGLADQWTREGWGGLNYGRYASPAFDSLFRRASAEADPGVARRLYVEAMDTLNADAPAIFLYSPTNSAAVSRRIAAVRLDPLSWLGALPEWELR
ncbi:MAG TPA: ABC transporter substrate-binding protein [Gemmatimonadales bacterium]|nr:ABC transporter substrate-binding protein [Gemmatimonadales bacterium]